MASVVPAYGIVRPPILVGGVLLRAPMSALPYPPPYQDLATLAQHVCCGESTIENWVKLGLFPPPKKIGGKRLWRWKDVERHLADEGDSVPSSADLAQRITDATRRATAKSG